MELQSGDLAGCSILMSLSCWRKSRTPEHVEVWRYHLGSSYYHLNAAWQMTLRCFAKCPCRAHQWGICWGAHKTIWHHCEKLPRRVPKHHQLGPYKPGTFAGSAHQVNDVPQAYHLLGKIEIWTHHQKWHAAIGLLSGYATSVPTPSGDGHGWQSTGASLWVYRHGRRQGPSTYEAIRRIILNKAWSRRGVVFWGVRSPRGLVWHQSASGSLLLKDPVDRSTSQNHVPSNSTLQHVFMGKCKHFMPNIL